MQQNCIFSQFWRVEVWDQNVFKGDFFWCLLLGWRWPSPLYVLTGSSLYMSVCMCAQSWPPLCCPHGLYPPGFSVHGIFQARILEWIAISFSRGSSWPGMEPTSLASPALQADSLSLAPPGKPFECPVCIFHKKLRWMKIDFRTICVNS